LEHNNCACASDLNTLAPKTWLNDNVIDLTTQVLASRAITESKRVVAVFDSQFTKLILETPKQPTTAGTGMDYYIYDKVVGVAEKQLLGKSPLDFDCLLFPNGIYRNHWNIMVVFPKHRLMIAALDSLKVGSVKDARIIFRWMYDETKYNHPGDA
jgi:Ulp1 family protease